MKSKSAIKCLSSNNNSRSCTQDFKPVSTSKQWDEILGGIDAIASKVKQISGLEYQAEGSTKKKHNNKCQTSKLSTRVNTTFDCSRSQSRKKDNRKYGKSSRTNQPICTHNISEKILKRMLTYDICCKNQNKESLNKSRTIDERSTADRTCQSKCHEIMTEMTQLKKINDQLIKKNQQLEKRLNQQKQQRSKLKYQRQKANQIVLRVIKENQYENTFQNPKLIQLQLKSRRYPDDNDHIRLSPPKKQFKEREERKKFVDLSKQRKPNGNDYASIIESHHLSKPSQLKSLETQFDRLMQISYLQRNKARKRVIWDEMKSIANKLKMMRYFTQNN